MSHLKRETALQVHLKRLGSCLALGVVMAMMIGKHTGSQNDYGLGFRESVLKPRIFLFLAAGVVVYLLITFWPKVAPYLSRPGVRPLAMGALTVMAGYSLLRWSDTPQLPDTKLGPLAAAARGVGELDGFTRAFFGSIVPGSYWLLFLIVFVLGGAALILRNRALGWVVAVLAVAVGVWGLSAQLALRSFLKVPDHSTGGYVQLLGYLAIAGSAAVMAYTHAESADTRGFINRVFNWRPGFPLVVLGSLTGLIALLGAGWFAPLSLNAKWWDMTNVLGGEAISALTSAYLGWLVWVLFLGTATLAAVATARRNRSLGWAAAGAGILSVLVTLVTIHDFSKVAAAKAFDGATGPWQNVGVGPWALAGAFTLLAGAGWMVASRPTVKEIIEDAADSDAIAAGTSLNVTRALLVAVIAGALFYPPTATGFWQTVLVSEIGIYVLLAIGLNVVVGWAGLLDLGFIAFYAIGSYTTAFLTGTLPVKPPSFLHLPPLAAIPFAIAICLVAGIALGTPTLRLRGDYLAIMTLGFGEIIRIALNNDVKFGFYEKVLTNGPKGAFGIPHPHIKVGPLELTWGQNSLQYWYLLLVLVVLILLAFRRLENSRLGRAWAAVREDEVAAQATGINTVRTKLLAFAIGASTSGVAGVFFASQIGYINPANFVLNNSILVVAYVVFGGMGSLPGAMAGAAALTWLPEFLKDQVPAEDRQMWIGLIILLMMIFRPQGLIPARRRAIELEGLDKPKSPTPIAVPASEGM